ncbi:MAG: UDP-N-acetylmuramoyl-tripeptide--D-alanyl-D-alanine ligase [Clostridiales bacterium]|nr:UDP-N-acetylmuramoyl-tripeptide--D-alanyl-D-alanine ligase [Clostridiales bacterium]
MVFKEEFITVFVFACFLSTFFSVKILTLFQQCGYKLDEFYDCVFTSNKREIMRLSTYSLTFLAGLTVISLCLQKFKGGVELLVYAFSILLARLYFMTEKIIKPPNMTSRFMRIYLFSCLSLSFAVAFLSSMLVLSAKELRFLPLGLIPILCLIFIAVGWLIDFPYTKIRYLLSVSKCKRRLNSNKNLIKIGITGSFGKTTTKNYLYALLSKKFKVLVTPASYNTPLGICKTVKNDIGDYEVFIAEMGARRKNDIKTLCKIVKPSIGVLTGVTNQHTKTLGNLEDVKNAKYQLIDGLIGEKYKVFSADCEDLKSLYERAGAPKIYSGINGKRVNASQIKQTKDGIDFIINLDGESFNTFCPLLGEHNITDLCIAVEVALYLGVDKGKILSTIPTLKPPNHRAEIINSPTGITVIDDGYNANLEGIKSTAEAIKVLDGYKVAVTSGVVELGNLTAEINQKVGAVLSNTFDCIICVGSNAEHIEKGVNSNKKVQKVKSLNEATEILKQTVKSGDVVAFFNDIPDRY